MKPAMGEDKEGEKKRVVVEQKIMKAFFHLKKWL